MITLSIDSHQVYLNPDTSLRFDLVHPGFETEYLHASMIYPFDIPAHRNEHIFQHANHIVVNNKYRVYDCRFAFGGVINFSGKLILNKLTPEAFRASIIMNGFSVDSKDISLQDFSYDNDVTLGSTTAEIAAYIEENVYLSYPEVNYNFPLVYVPNWYGKDREHNQDFQDYVNFWIRVNDTIRQNIISETSPDNYNSLLPCIYLMYVVKKCFAHLGFQVTGDFLTHKELSQLIIFYNVPLDFGQKKYTVKAYNKNDQSNNSLSTKRMSFSNDYTPPYEDDDDCWDVSLKEYTIQREGFHDFSVTGQYRIDQTVTQYQHLVTISIYDTTDNETIESILLDPPVYNADTDFVVSNTGCWISASKIGNKICILFGARHLEMPGPTLEPSLITIKNALLDIKNVSFCGFNSFKKTLCYADHLPDISFGDLIAAISKAFGLYLLFDHEKSIVEINFLKDLITSNDNIDLSEAMIEDSHEIVLSSPQGFSYQFKWDNADYEEEKYFTEFNQDKYIGEFDCWQDLYIPTDLNVYAYVRNLNAICVYLSIEGKSDWHLHSYFYKPFIVSPAKNEISIGFAPLMMAYNSVVDKLTPASEIMCSSQLFPTGVNACGLHLLFYRGLDNQTYDYPFATPLTLDRFGDEQWDNSLRLDGEKGLMETFLGEWLDFQDNSIEVKMDFLIDLQTLQAIMQIFLPNPGKTRHKIHVHSIDYIPKKFSIMLSMIGIKSCQASLIKEGMIQV